MVRCKKWILCKQFEGEPSKANFTLEEEDLPDLGDREVMCEAVHVSVDPYVRVFPVAVGSVLPGQQVARVTSSKNKDFPVSTLVLGNFGWRSHTLVTDISELNHLPDTGDLSPSVALGAAGMTGITAYFGFLEICNPKEGDVVFVNAAAGGVGSIVGQIAKIKGCRVIGSCGTDSKCDWLRKIGFDDVFNYKTTDTSKFLAQAAPDGIDCFFDNVGGATANGVVSHLRQNGRMACCGSMSTYNLTEEQTGPLILKHVLMKTLKIEGVYCWSYMNRLSEGQAQLLTWIQEGKIVSQETVTEGFDNIISAFLGLFSGENVGKAIVNV